MTSQSLVVIPSQERAASPWSDAPDLEKEQIVIRSGNVVKYYEYEAGEIGPPADTPFEDEVLVRGGSGQEYLMNKTTDGLRPATFHALAVIYGLEHPYTRNALDEAIPF